MSRDSKRHERVDSSTSRRDVLKGIGGTAALGALGTFATGTAAAAPSLDAALLADDVDLNLYWQDDQAWYDATADKTFHVYQSVDTGGDSTGEEDSDGDAYAVSYDHSDGSVTGPVRIGYNDLPNGDTHGVPALAVDGDGYIHVIFGDHGNTGSLEYGRSENPRDITSWIHPPTGADGSSGLNQLPSGTYPSLAYDPNGDAVYVVYRAGNGSGNYPSHDHATLGKTTDNGVNWTDVNNGILDFTDAPWVHTDAYVTDLDAWAGRIHVSWAIAESDNHGDPRRNVYHAAYNPSTGNMETMSGTSLGSEVSYSEAVNDCMVKDTTDIDVSGDGRPGSVYDFNQTYDPNTDTAYIPVFYPLDSSTAQLRVMSYTGVSDGSGSWQESSQITTVTDPERLNSHVRVNDSGELEVKRGRGKDGLWRKESGTWNHYDYVSGTSEISKIQRPVKNGPDEFGWVGRDFGTTNGDTHRIVYALGPSGSQPSGAGATPTRPPQNLRATAVNGTVITLDWDNGLAGPSGVTKFKVYVDGVHQKDVTTPPVGGNPYPRTWTDIDVGTDGTYDVDVSLVNGNNTESATSNTITVDTNDDGQSPYGGSAWSIPGKIQGEDFDEGGDGVAWSDTTPNENEGNASYRPNEGVDISNADDFGGTEYNISYVDADEWLEYTVDVDSSGNYDLDLRVATAQTGGKDMHVEVDGTNVTGLVTVNDTGGWQTYTTKTVTGISLSAGQHIVRVYFDDAAINFNFMEWNSAGGDSTAPTAPSNLSSPAHDASSVDLDWDASSDSGGSGLDHYNVYVDGAKDHEVAAGTTQTTVSDLGAGTSYDFHVTAVDGANNESGDSNTVTQSTDSLPGMVSRWTFDGTSATDAVGSNDGTMNGGITTGVSGKDGNAWDFDGTDDYVSVSDDASLNPTDMTVSLWVNTSNLSASDQSYFYRKWNYGNATGYHLIDHGEYGDDVRFSVAGGGSYYHATTPRSTVNDGNWHHLVGTKNGGEIRLYLDGQQVDSTTGAQIDTNSGDLGLGASPGGANLVDGVMDDVRLWDEALTADEVAGLYNSY